MYWYMAQYYNIINEVKTCIRWFSKLIGKDIEYVWIIDNLGFICNCAVINRFVYLCFCKTLKDTISPMQAKE